VLDRVGRHWLGGGMLTAAAALKGVCVCGSRWALIVLFEPPQSRYDY
jgi:hypothetical protein